MPKETRAKVDALAKDAASDLGALSAITTLFPIIVASIMAAIEQQAGWPSRKAVETFAA